MPPAYSSAQKAAITQFTSFTGADRTNAAKILRQNNWDVQTAVNAYFNGPASSAPASNVSRSSLGKVFDKYRDDPRASADTIGMEGTAGYLEALGVSIEDIGFLVVSEVVKSPSMGEIKRDGFMEGWSALGCDTFEKQKSYIAATLQALPQPSSKPTFNRIYKFTFQFGRVGDARTLPLETALEFWRVLFGSSSSPSQWSTANSPFLEWWCNFLEEKWKKSVNKDMWDQTLKFAEESLKDESLKWWSEEAAWPGVIDEFVEYVAEKRPKVDEDEVMEED